MTHPAISPGRMSRVDCAWLRMDKPTNRMVITGVLLMDGLLTRDDLKAVLESRLLSIERFRQRVAFRNGKPHWELDPDFDIDRHVVEDRLPEPGDDRALQDHVSYWMSRDLDPEHPCWQARLVHNYQGGSALVFRIHHCIGDGIALMLVLLSLTESRNEETGELYRSPLRSLFDPEPISPEAARDHLSRVMPAAVKLLTLPAQKLAELKGWQKAGASVPAFSKLALRPPDPRTQFKGKLGVEQRATWSRPLRLDDVEAVRRGLGGTVNDVLTSALAGALGRYLAGDGTVSERLKFRAVVPVNLRPLEEMAALGNQFGLVFLSLPVGIRDPIRRLAEVRRRMSALKRSFEPVVALKVLGLLGASPELAQKLAVSIFGAKGTAVLTNVPGPRRTLYFGGRPIRSFIFWVPRSANLSMGLSIASYAGEVRLGVATDVGLVPDPETIVAGFHDEFDRMAELAASSGGASRPA
ncbi:MAG: wax ester/triacylglycerol synthase family O-acyltransferase [Thermoanaerobaculia bacterium]|nr:wax ester/triacylglycerol synthase family O-acyltransferase [Thermoanaerobaculia bacterium]